ncbi:MAG: DNA recombination protein RmuC [Caulobacterales bacterium]
MTESLLLFLLVAAVGASAWFFYRSSKEREIAIAEKARNAGLDLIRQERDRAVAELEKARADQQEARSDLAAEKAANAERLRAGAEREQALLKMKEELEKNFETLASRALSQNEQRFITLANETFQKHQSAAAGGVKEILAPAQEMFAKLSESVSALDKARTEDKSALTEQLRFVGEHLARTQVETNKLVNALRAAPKTRGRWGEETLRNVLELSGLSAHADFTEQTTTTADDGKMLRPDVIIRLPGGRSIVVDAKVALSGYLDAMEATDEQTRETCLKKHAQELRDHVKKLSSKDYSKHFAETADFVALFIPGENFFAAAVERDPTLFEDAMKLRVVIVTPVTLMALARSIAYGWRQEQSAKNAQEIADLGRELYNRLATMSDRVSSLGNSIEKSVKSYNELIGTLDSRVMPSARRFKELGASDSGVEIAQAVQIDTAPRLPAPQAEFELTPPMQRKKSAG